MINFDDVTKENIKEYNPNWPKIPGHLYRMLITGVFGLGKINILLNQQPEIDKIFMLKIHAKQNINF